MAVDVDIDVQYLKSEIKRTYAEVSQQPEKDFIFPTGSEWAADLDYPADLLARVPTAAAESFAGVANPFSLGPLHPGERALDLGCGAGTDTLVAAQMVGPEGRVTGIDMTRIRANRDRDARRDLRALEVRGHAAQGREVRRPRHDRQGVQAGLNRPAGKGAGVAGPPRRP